MTGDGGGGGVLGHHHLRAGSIESPPLVVKNRSLMLPFNPSPGHWVQSIDALPQAGVSACSKWWTSLMSPNLDVGPWTSNCWMSLSTELSPRYKVESFC